MFVVPFARLECRTKVRKRFELIPPLGPLAAAALCMGLLAGPVAAVQPKFWRLTSAKDFIGGELKGTALATPGSIRLSPAMRRVAEIGEPLVLSLARDSKGNIYVGTGNRGRVFRISPGGETELICTVPELEVTALVCDAEDRLYAGTSPRGKIYRVEAGKATPWFDPLETYIWSLALGPDGALYAGTGTAGKIFRITSHGGEGRGEVFFDTADTNIVCLAWAGGALLAGGQGQGLVYRIPALGKGAVLFDSNLTEISALVAGEDGKIYAAAMAGDPTLAPPAKDKARETKPEGAEEPAKTSSAESGVSVSVSFDPQPLALPVQIPGGITAEVYRLDAEGFAEMLWQFNEEVVYTLAWREGSLRLGTGLAGKLYALDGRDLTLVRDFDEKQIVESSSGSTGFVLATANPGAVYLQEGSYLQSGEYVSPVQDSERFSRWGNFAWEGQTPPSTSVSFAFRAGNSAIPDVTWSPWREFGGTPSISLEALPAGRFVQWRATLRSDSAARSPEITETSLAYANRNVAPVIEAVTVLDPGVVFVKQNMAGGLQVFEASSPDRQGIFSVLDESRNPHEGTGKKLWKKGYRTVSWKVTDANGDGMRFDVFLRPLGGANWVRLRDDLEDDLISFDTTALADGRYELRVVARDDPSNPTATAARGEKTSPPMLVDNSAPEVELSESGSGTTRGMRARVKDRYNPIVKLEYAMDAEKWIELVPDDGIADSPEETYGIDLPREALAGDHWVMVRATDSAFNIGTASLSIQGR